VWLREEAFTMAKFQVYRDNAGKYRFRLRADNDEVVASSEAYESKPSAEHGVDVIKRTAPTADVEDLT
jgi:uncharacterized protein YegP (UPF0339 family)